MHLSNIHLDINLLILFRDSNPECFLLSYVFIYHLDFSLWMAIGCERSDGDDRAIRKWFCWIEAKLVCVCTDGSDFI